MRLSEIETKRAQKLNELKALLDVRDQASREFTADEATRFDALEAEVEQLNVEHAREFKAESIRKQTALNSANTKAPEEKVAERFSFAQAVRDLSRGKATGLVAEMSQEADNELKRSGIAQTVEGVGIPSFLVNMKGKNVYGSQKRDLTSGGTATGLEYVAELEKMHQYGLEIAPKALSLGVEVWTGLTGNVYVNETGQATSVWEGENDGNAETTPATSRPVSLSPKRLGAFADISKTLLAQTSGVAEERVKVQLQKAQNRKLDETIFQGTGIAPIPTGILSTSNVNTATGGTPSRQTFLDMWAAIAADEALFSELGIAMPADIYAFLMGAYVDAGSGRFVLENGQINGIPVIYSNNMPANNILLGDFSKFVLGVWGGVDLVINPYTRAKESILEVVVNQFFDMGCLYPQAFCKITDASIA